MDRGALPLRAVPLALALCASSCLTSRTDQPASTIGRGHSAVGLEASGVLFPISGLGCSSDRLDCIGAVPAVTAWWTHGVTDALELRLSAGQEGLGVQPKLALLQRPDRLGLAVSVAPYAGAGFWQDGYGYGVELPVLIGWRTSSGFEVTAAVSTRYDNTFSILSEDAEKADPLVQGVSHRVEWSSAGTVALHTWTPGGVRFGFGLGVRIVHRARVGIPLPRGELTFTFELPISKPQPRTVRQQ